MKYIVIFMLLVNGGAAFSQSADNKSYLVVRIPENYDKVKQKRFFEIKAEWGCDSAYAVYSLVKYANSKSITDTAALYYYITGLPANGNIYNYFNSPTEALNFLSKNGWRLHSMVSELFSGSTLEPSGGELVPITTVKSRLVYCFER
jgi:hypothetical protein